MKISELLRESSASTNDAEWLEYIKNETAKLKVVADNFNTYVQLHNPKGANVNINSMMQDLSSNVWFIEKFVIHRSSELAAEYQKYKLERKRLNRIVQNSNGLTY
jgi:hypothetical protein